MELCHPGECVGSMCVAVRVRSKTRSCVIRRDVRSSACKPKTGPVAQCAMLCELPFVRSALSLFVRGSPGPLATSLKLQVWADVRAGHPGHYGHGLYRD